jgi:hypothetical protein
MSAAGKTDLRVQISQFRIHKKYRQPAGDNRQGKVS